MVFEGQSAWLLGASYKPGRVILKLFSSDNLEPIEWTVSDFQPYYLTTEAQRGEPVKKLDLFTGKELNLHRVSLMGKPPRDDAAWEVDVYPAFSYAYD